MRIPKQSHSTGCSSALQRANEIQSKPLSISWKHSYWLQQAFIWIFWAAAQHTQVLQVGLRAKVTPWLQVEAVPARVGRDPCLAHRGKGDLEHIVFAFVMQIELISPRAQQLGTSVHLPKGKNPLEATLLEYFINPYTLFCVPAYVSIISACPTRRRLHKYFLFPGNPGNH